MRVKLSRILIFLGLDLTNKSNLSSKKYVDYESFLILKDLEDI